MCDYGIGRNITSDELRTALHSGLAPYSNQLERLLFGSYGSVLDEDEISQECLDVILEYLNEYPVKNVIFETHCETVTSEKLKRIKNGLPQSTSVTIEMGYESCDPFIVHDCLNKHLDFKKLEDAILKIHESGMDVCLNVFLGAPFLCSADQFHSTRKSILWADEKGADSVVLFPCNIKPFTAIHKLYEKGLYSPISQWMIPLLFSTLSPNILKKLTLSWYGDRKNFYKNDEFPLIPPKDCDKCHDLLFGFYRAFMDEPDGSIRMQMTEGLLNRKMACRCLEDTKKTLAHDSPHLTAGQIAEIVSRLDQ